MRWTKPTPREGDRRVVQKFLFLPKCLDGEWRWLERAKIVQRYIDHEAMVSGWHYYGTNIGGWTDCGWSDDDEQS